MKDARPLDATERSLTDVNPSLPVTPHSRFRGRPGFDRLRLSYPRVRLAVIGVFVALVLLYVGTSRGATFWADDYTMFRTTASLVDQKALRLTEPAPDIGISRNLRGEAHSKYGPGLPLVMVPAYWVGGHAYQAALGRLTALDRETFLVLFVMLTTNPLITAATAAILTWGLVGFGYRLSTALVTGLGYGASTFAWHYAEGLFSEPLATWCLFIAVVTLWWTMSRNQSVWLPVSGFALGFLIVTRVFNVLIVPVFLFFVVWYARRRLWLVGLWLAPIVFCLSGLALYNWLRFGSALETGYGAEAQGFHTPLETGLTGLLLSPGKSLFLYNPILVIGFFGIRDAFRRQPRLISLIGLLTLVYVIGYGKFDTWWGGGSWGPRFLLPMLPLWMIFVAGGLTTLTRSRPGRLASVAVIAASALVQFGGVLIDFAFYWSIIDLYYRTIPNSAPLDFVWRQIYDPVFSPIVVHLWLLLTGYQLNLAGLRHNSLNLLVIQILSGLGAGIIVSALLSGYINRQAPNCDKLERPKDTASAG